MLLTIIRFGMKVMIIVAILFSGQVKAKTRCHINPLYLNQITSCSISIPQAKLLILELATYSTNGKIGKGIKKLLEKLFDDQKEYMKQIACDEVSVLTRLKKRETNFEYPRKTLSEKKKFCQTLSNILRNPKAQN